MRAIEKIEHFSSYIPFIWFCFYLMSVLLIGGGIKKIYHNYRRSENSNEADNHK
jgi:flagellar biosynthesis/type III secretory pathway M-ring protein FliF/YscJ